MAPRVDWRAAAIRCMIAANAWGYSFEMNGLVAMGGRSNSWLLLASAAALAALARRRAAPVAAAAAGRDRRCRPGRAGRAPRPPPERRSRQSRLRRRTQRAAAGAAPLPPPLPPRGVGPGRARRTCVYYIQQIGGEGLNPADYDPAGLDAAMRSGDPLAMSAGRDRALQPAVVRPRARPCQRAARIDWYVVDKDLDAARQDALLRSALATHQRPPTRSTACCRPIRNMRR